MNASDDATPAPRVLATIIDGPLTREREVDALASHGWTHGSASRGCLIGAMLRFEGVVRRREPYARPGEGVGGATDERDLLALDYNTYDPMAERELLALARSVAERHGLIALSALHSRGRVHVGELSFVLIVESAHRAEGLAAMTDFIDRLKQDVPIWKRPVWR